jgi:putative ABC transport system substrate-binding protein
MAGKMLGLLTEIAPGVKQVAIMFNPATAAGGGSYFLPTIEATARSLKRRSERQHTATPKLKRS